MHARKITVSLFALAFGLTLSAFAGAAADAPAADATKPSQAAEKACCKHHEGAGEKAGMHCDHAKMKAAGAKSDAGCAKHAAMRKEGAAGDGKACCAQHADMAKECDKSDCCCCGGGESCEHHAAAEAPAKS